MNLPWWALWYQPLEDEVVAYMTSERIATIGGSKLTGTHGQEEEFVNQGVAMMVRWCRINCTTIPRPVNVRGQTGFVFTNSADAILFKLTWG